MMDTEYTLYKNNLIDKVIELHELTKETCSLCGGSYEENLDGATSYFSLRDSHFKISVEEIGGM